MSANHITYYNSFEKNLSHIIKFVSDNDRVIDSDRVSLYYDKQLNYKLFAQDKNLKYYFTISVKFHKKIMIHYKSETDYFVSVSYMNNIIIKSKLSFTTFLKENYLLLLDNNSYFLKDDLSNGFDFNNLLKDNIYKMKEYSFNKFLDTILDKDITIKHILDNTSINKIQLDNIVDDYFIKNISAFSILSEDIKNNISEKCRKEYDHYFNASQFDLV